MERKQKRHGQRGFTIIELMIVCVVIGILAAIGIPNYLKFSDRAREALVKENMHVLHSGMEAYSIDHLGVYPTAADESDLEDLMPNHSFPQNPFNNAVSTLTWDADPGSPGDLGILFLANGGYEIKGYGRDNVLDHTIRTGN